MQACLPSGGFATSSSDAAAARGSAVRRGAVCPRSGRGSHRVRRAAPMALGPASRLQRVLPLHKVCSRIQATAVASLVQERPAGFSRREQETKRGMSSWSSASIPRQQRARAVGS